MSDQKHSARQPSRLRWFSSQVGINVVAGWVGGILVAGFGWLIAPSHWAFVAQTGIVLGSAVGLTALIGCLKWRACMAVSALSLGFSIGLLGVDLLRGRVQAHDGWGTAFSIMLILYGVFGLAWGMSLAETHLSRRRRTEQG